jgi:hypothetical protein
LGVSDGPGDASEATSCLDLGDEVELFRRGGAAIFDLDSGEDGKLLADHVGGDGDGAVADEIGAALAEPVAHQAAGWVFERPGVVTKEAGATTADCEADVVLDCQLIRTPSAGVLGR